ncbi:aminoglycoside phosphotransferase family protein [Microbacterium sp. BWT-B31]|uniref:aminoglycoside phosphotransferase family protein n=1 Tax=Microbacterium sp. BWT-B31 TaxID=3232072 RepID=UPI00352977AE
MTTGDPHAASNRIPWGSLPPAVRARVEDRAGARVTDAGLAPGGFSAGYAGIVTFEGGERLFVKAGDGATNAETARLHRREAEVTAGLPAGIAPRLTWMIEHDAWVVISLEPIDGRHPGAPWTDDDLSAVLAAQARLAAASAPPVLEPLAPSIAEMLTGWSRLIAEDRVDIAPEWVRGRAAELANLEGDAVAAAAAGDAIVQLDMRSDNVLIEHGAVRLVDWPHAGRGADWLDVAFFAPTVPLEGGPPAAEVFARSPLADTTAPDDLLAIVSGWAGRQLWASRQPAPPGIPHLRAFQAAQAGATLDWLGVLLASG